MGQGNLTMRKCTKKPGAFECEEIELLGVQLEACYCESDLCNKDQWCTCGLKCQTCLGEDGACLDSIDNGISSYCLKGQSCAYVHRGNFSWIDLELFIFIESISEGDHGVSVSRRCDKLPESGETCEDISEKGVSTYNKCNCCVVNAYIYVSYSMMDTFVTVMNLIVTKMSNVLVAMIKVQPQPQQLKVQPQQSFQTMA